jgi:hypothetical protein
LADLGPGAARPTSACGWGGAPIKPGLGVFRRPHMIAIGVIVIFLVVFGALNLYEFGRLD